MKQCPNCGNPHNDNHVEDHCTPCYYHIFLNEDIIESDQFKDL